MHQPTKDATIHVVKREPESYSTGTFQPMVPAALDGDQLRTYHYSREANLFPDNHLQWIQIYEQLQYQQAEDEPLLHNIL